MQTIEDQLRMAAEAAEEGRPVFERYDHEEWQEYLPRVKNRLTGFRILRDHGYGYRMAHERKRLFVILKTDRYTDDSVWLHLAVATGGLKRPSDDDVRYLQSRLVRGVDEVHEYQSENATVRHLFARLKP